MKYLEMLYLHFYEQFWLFFSVGTVLLIIVLLVAVVFTVDNWITELYKYFD
jgi:hypothetical protein